MTQLHGLSSPRPSRRAVNACRSFAMTDSNSANGIPRLPFVAPQIHWCRICRRGTRFSLLSHMVFSTPSNSNPRRHLDVAKVPSPLRSFLSEIGSVLSALLGGKRLCIPWRIPLATCSTCGFVVGMIHATKSSTYAF